MAESIRDDFIEFVQNPTRENYLALHRAITTWDEYDPYGHDPEDVAALLEQGRAFDARERINHGIVKWLLSPRMHVLAAVAAEKLGDADAAALEREIAVRCVEGILSTGDGSAESPYAVTSTADEYDVLAYQTKTFASQALVGGAAEKTMDRITCTDGSVLHFDISAPYRTLARRRVRGGPRGVSGS